MACKETMLSLEGVFKKLRIKITKLQKQSHKKGYVAYRLYISNQSEIQKFFDIIEPMNQKHVERFEKIKKGENIVFTDNFINKT